MSHASPAHDPHDPHAAGAHEPQEREIFPAGASYAHSHHGHTIVSKRILVGILVLLMLFTGLTVMAAQIEVFIAHTFDVTIPQWLNAVVALSIAAVKSVLVAMFFMQLRYDNPMNALVAIFTIFTLAFFLGFTMIDLGNRKIIYAYKGEQIIAGGTSLQTGAGKSHAELARLRADEEIARLQAEGKPLPKHLQKYLDHKSHGHGAHGHGDHADDASSANASRVRTGLTLPELKGDDAAAQPHGEKGAH